MLEGENMEKHWQTRSGDDVLTFSWVGDAAGVAIADDSGSAAIRLEPEQLHSLREWLVQLEDAALMEQHRDREQSARAAGLEL